jgi:hypothetical protein
MTDALAQWFLTEHEGGRHPWEALEEAQAASNPATGFATWVGELRARGALRNDDTTLLSITL